MNSKTLGLAALAALCLMPAASANTPDDPWGPDVSVIVDFRHTAECEASDHEAGPVSVSEERGDPCVFTVAYDGENVKALCGPDGVGPIVIYDDCDVDVFVVL